MKPVRRTAMSVVVFIIFMLAVVVQAIEIQTQPVRTVEPAIQQLARPKAPGNMVPQHTPRQDIRELNEVQKKKLKLLPDLIVETFTVTPVKPVAGDKVTMRVTIRNKGEKSLKNIGLVYMAGRRKIAEDTLSIKAGGVVKSEKKTVFDKSGPIRLEVLVDPQRRIKELDKKNNKKVKRIVLAQGQKRKPPVLALQTPGERTVPNAKVDHGILRQRMKRSGILKRDVRVTPDVKGGQSVFQPKEPTRRRLAVPKAAVRLVPDLAAARFSLNRKKIAPGQSVVVHATFTYSGDPDLQSFPVTFYVDDRAVGKRMVLPRYETTDTITFRYTLKDPGSYRLSARIDPDNKIRERNEKNNSLEGRVEVRLPELADMRGASRKKVTSLRDRLPSGQLTKRNNTKMLAVSEDTAETGIRPLRKVGRVTDVKTLPPMETKDGLAFYTLLPKKDAVWLNGHLYDIKWFMAGKDSHITKVSLKKVGESFSKDITPKAIDQDSKDANVFSFSYKVPPKLAGVFRIVIDATVVLNGKKQKMQVKSPIFVISLKGTGDIDGEIADLLKAVDWESLHKYELNRPVIKHLNSYKKNGNLYFDIYWEDGDGDMYDGSWTFEYSDNGHWQKFTFKLSNSKSKLLNSQFYGKKGLAQPHVSFSGKPATSFRFFITDKSGKKSNIVNGFINQSGEQIRPTPLFLAPSLAFTAPKPTGVRDQSVVDWVTPGQKYKIKLGAHFPEASSKSVAVELSAEELLTPGSFKIGKITVPTDGSVYTYTWKIPDSSKKFPGFSSKNVRFRLVATTSVSGKQYVGKSGHLAIADYQLKLTTPTAGSIHNAGSMMTIGWVLPKKVPAGETLDFFYITSHDNYFSHLTSTSGKKLNSSPVPVGAQAWQWKIDPREVVPGDGIIVVKSSSTNYASTNSIPVKIVFPSDVEPLHFSFTQPKKAEQWFAGEKELIKWKTTVPKAWLTLVSPDTDVTIGHYAANDINSCESFVKKPLEIFSGYGINSGSEFFPVPSSAKDGMCRLVAIRPDIGTIVGKGPLISIVSKANANALLPQPGTKFSISRVDYPYLSKPEVRLDIKTKSGTPFKLSGAIKQQVEFKISNYTGGKSPAEIAISGKIDTVKNPDLFPNLTVPKGDFGYNIGFSPQVYKPVKTWVSVADSPASGPFSAGSLCMTRYYPKLEVSVRTTLADGSVTTALYKKYLEQFVGMVEEKHGLGGTVNICAAVEYW